jgi:uncharacterized membrane protein YphA (DoxX/SURF4 family)
MKAMLLMAMLASAEVQQHYQGTHFGDATEQVDVSNVERVAKELELMTAEPQFQEQKMDAMLTDPLIQGQAKRVAGQIEALMALPKAQEQVKRVAKQLEAFMAAPSVQEQVRVFLKKVEAMRPETNLTGPATFLDETMKALEADLHVQEQAKHVARQLKLLLADPSFQKQGKHIAEQFEELVTDRNLQEQAAVFSGPSGTMMASKAPPATSPLKGLVGRRFKTSSLDHADLEDTVFGKSSSLAIRPDMGVNSLVVPPSTRAASLRPPAAKELQSRPPLSRLPGSSSAMRALVRTKAARATARGASGKANFLKGKSKPEPEPEDEFELFGRNSEELEKIATDAVFLLARLAIASQMIHHGYEKYFSAELFTKYAIDKYFNFLPGPHLYWTYIVGGIQFFAPFGLGLGVFSRVSSASLAGVMVGAALQSFLSLGTEGFPLTKMASNVPIFHNYGFELPVVYVSAFLLFAVTGPGKYSVAQALGWNDDKSLLGKIKQ